MCLMVYVTSNLQANVRNFRICSCCLHSNQTDSDVTKLIIDAPKVVFEKPSRFVDLDALSQVMLSFDSLFHEHLYSSVFAAQHHDRWPAVGQD